MNVSEYVKKVIDKYRDDVKIDVKECEILPNSVIINGETKIKVEVDYHLKTDEGDHPILDKIYVIPKIENVIKEIRNISDNEYKLILIGVGKKYIGDGIKHYYEYRIFFNDMDKPIEKLEKIDNTPVKDPEPETEPVKAKGIKSKKKTKRGE